MFIKYPATKKELVAACKCMEDVPEEDKEWFIKNLPDGIYESIDDILEAVEK